MEASQPDDLAHHALPETGFVSIIYEDLRQRNPIADLTAVINIDYHWSVSKLTGGGLGPLVVCVVSHPDDEVLSSGAILLRARSRGYRLHLVWVTDGESTTGPAASARREEAMAVANKLGATHDFLGLPDGKTSLSDVISRVEAVLTPLAPQIVVWPFTVDKEHHQDHVTLHDAMLNISRRSAYEGRSWLAGQPPVFDDGMFRPHLYVPYGAALMDDVLELLALHASEAEKPFAQPQFTKNRAGHCADVARCGTEFAEPYVVQKGAPPQELFRAFRVDLFHPPNGAKPVEDELEKLGTDEQRRALALIQYLADHGTSGITKPYLSLSQGGLHCLSNSVKKAFVHILFLWNLEDDGIVLHVFRGDRPRPDARHVGIARERQKQWSGLRETKRV